MSGKAVGWVFEHSPLSGDRLVVHLALADVANDLHGWELWITIGALAAKARCSTSTARRTVQQLLEEGFLDALDGGGGRGKPARYRFIFPDLDLRRSPSASPKGSQRERVSAEEPSHSDTLSGAKPCQPEPETLPPTSARASRDEPKEPKNTAPKRDAANEITVAYWESRNPRPMQKFLAIRQIVQQALTAGFKPAEIARALPRCEPPIVSWKLEKALLEAARARADVTNPAAERFWESN